MVQIVVARHQQIDPAQAAMPQPNLVPVRFNSSRSTHSKGVLGSAVAVWLWPLMFSCKSYPL